VAKVLPFDDAAMLDPGLKALVEIRTAQLNGSTVVLVRLARDALARGETHERLSALGAWRHSGSFTTRERAALGLAEALALLPNARALAAARSEAAEELSESELSALVAACARANARDRVELAKRPGTPPTQPSNSGRDPR
jgi:alkylhydroperoxidase family enzyme